MISCGVIGATGYAGAELSRLLLGHSEVGRLALGSSSKRGESMELLYPNLAGAFGRGGSSGKDASPLLLSPEEALEGADVVFAALPHGHAEVLAESCREGGKLLVDLSADFRFGAEETVYRTWYGKAYEKPELHAASVYGLPELNRARIRGASIIGNPGCYPTSAALGLFPALRLGLAEPEGIVIDAASGLSGAGREPSESSHYMSVADTLSPYKIGAHRHGPEIDAALSAMAGEPVSAVFTPHLAPMGRGIVSSIYFRLRPGVAAEGLRAAYEAFYAEEPFVRVLPEGLVANNRTVRHSNYCDLSVHAAAVPGFAIVISAIDNMVKGAAGQAVQNMNIALGLDERAGISMLPPAF